MCTADRADPARLATGLQRPPRVLETRQQARDRGYRDGWDGRPAGYESRDDGDYAASRELAYYTGYGEGRFARRTGHLPCPGDRRLR